MYKSNWKFKNARTSPVILLCPEDIRVRPNHQPIMHSHKNLKVFSYKELLRLPIR